MYIAQIIDGQIFISRLRIALTSALIKGHVFMPVINLLSQII